MHKLFGNSKDGSGDIFSTHDYAHWMSLSLLINAQGEGKSIYFRSGKPEADGSFEVYHNNRLKENIGHDMCFQLLFIHSITDSEMTSRLVGIGKILLSRSMQNKILSFNLVSTSRTRQHW